MAGAATARLGDGGVALLGPSAELRLPPQRGVSAGGSGKSGKLISK